MASHSVFHRSSYHTSGTCIQYFWIDALCINQTSEWEQSRQVRIMGKIYSKAAEVTVWLGPIIFATPCGPNARRNATATQAGTSHPLHTLEKKHSDQICDSSGIDIREICEQPYWSRMWIVQELLLATGARIVTGDHALPLEQFREMANQYYQDNAIRGKTFRKISPFSKDTSPETRSLYALMIDFSNWQCTDERDRVFALLSLVPLQERQVLETFFPDYSMDRESVITITLSFLLHVSKIDFDDATECVFHKGLGRSLYHAKEIEFMQSQARDFDINMSSETWRKMRYRWQKELLIALKRLPMRLEELVKSMSKWPPQNNNEDSELPWNELHHWKALIEARKIEKQIVANNYDPLWPYKKRIMLLKSYEKDLERAEEEVEEYEAQPDRSRLLARAQDQVRSAKYLRDHWTADDGFAFMQGGQHDFEDMDETRRDTELRAFFALEAVTYRHPPIDWSP